MKHQNVISFNEYKKKMKNLQWLYELSEFELICEFIESHNQYESDKSSTEKMDWLDTVSSVVSIRCFKTKAQSTSGSLLK